MMEQLMREKVTRWARVMARMTPGPIMAKLERRLPTATSCPRRRRLAPTSQRSKKICERKIGSKAAKF